MSGELVVLLSEEGVPIGTADKATVHGMRTPLHLGFSCYVFDSGGRVLVSRRSLAKRTWPGVWTNSFCGHPGPGEPAETAVRRRALDELRVDIHSVECVLPAFSYVATDPSGVVENEHCPVYVARTDDDPRPSPAEVADWQWTTSPALLAIARDAPWAISPWAALQLPLLGTTLMRVGGGA